jgi:hypothetical protein
VWRFANLGWPDNTVVSAHHERGGSQRKTHLFRAPCR